MFDRKRDFCERHGLEYNQRHKTAKLPDGRVFHFKDELIVMPRVRVSAEDTDTPTDFVRMPDGGMMNIMNGRMYDVESCLELKSDLGQYHFRTKEYVLRERLS